MIVALLDFTATSSNFTQVDPVHAPKEMHTTFTREMVMIFAVSHFGQKKELMMVMPGKALSTVGGDDRQLVRQATSDNNVEHVHQSPSIGTSAFAQELGEGRLLRATRTPPTRLLRATRTPSTTHLGGGGKLRHLFSKPGIL